MMWSQLTLAKVAKEFISGGTPSTKVERYWAGEIPWITGADVTDKVVATGRKCITREAIEHSATHIVPKGALLIVTRTGVGKVAKAGADIAISQDLTGIVLKDGIDTDFVVTAIQHKIGSLQHIQQGAIIKGVLRKDVEKLEIPLPAPSEQRKIVEILDHADALRQQRLAADEKAQRIIPALFYKMFGDPATWKLEGSAEPLGKLVAPQGGGTPTKSNPEYWGGDIPWVSPKDMKRDFIDDAEDHITQKALDETNARLIPVNSILIVVRGMILARHVPLAINVVPVTINQDMKALTVEDQRVSPLYLFAAMKVLSDRLHAKIATAAHGTRKLDTDDLLSLPILIPDRDRHDSFVRLFERIRELNALRSTTGPQIQRSFDILLHRAFTGELTAKWREAHREQLEAEMQEQLQALEEAKATAKPRRGRRRKAVT